MSKLCLTQENLGNIHRRRMSLNRPPLKWIQFNALPEGFTKNTNVKEEPQPSLPVNSFKHLELNIGDPADIFDVTEYENIIYRSLRDSDNQLPHLKFCQTDITLKDRNLLIDRFCEHHFNLESMTSTFYRFIGIFDRFISNCQVSFHSIDLYAFASYFIASKIEELEPVFSDDLVQISGDAISREELLEAEIKVYNCINYETEFPLPLDYLTQFIRISGQTTTTHLLSRYILEVIQSHEAFFGLQGSLMASVAVLITRFLSLENESWPSDLQGYSGYTKQDLMPYAHLIHKALLDGNRQEMRFIKRKYGSKIFHRVARCEIPTVFK